MKRSRKVFFPVFGLAAGILIAFIPVMGARTVIPIQVIPANVLDLLGGNLSNGVPWLDDLGCGLFFSCEAVPSLHSGTGQGTAWF